MRRFFDGKKGGTFFTKEGTVFPSESCPRGTNFTREFCPGGHYSQGDNLNCDTVTAREYQRGIFKNVLSNVFLLHSLGEGNFKVRGDGQYFTSECNNSSIALASYNFAFTSLNFDESHKLH